MENSGPISEVLDVREPPALEQIGEGGVPDLAVASERVWNGEEEEADS